MGASGGTGSRREHLVAIGVALAVLVFVVGLMTAVGAGSDDDSSSVVAGAPVAAPGAGDDGATERTAASDDAPGTTMGATEHDHATDSSGAMLHEHDAGGSAPAAGHDDDHPHTDATTGAHDAEHAHDGATPASASAAGDGHEHDHVDAPTTPGATTAPGHAHEHPTETTQPGSPPTTAHVHEPVMPTGPITSLDDPRLTATQRTAAQSLLDTTKAAMAKFPTPQSVKDAGYVHIGDGGNGFEHWIREDYLGDGVELDPNKIESIVIQRNGNGTKTVASAMYILNEGKTMADVPQIAGELTTWHIHDNLCFIGTRLSGILVNGKCTPGGTLRVTPPMLHVWIVPHDCGPFAGIEGHGGDCASHNH
jgi:hypothetical protein